MTGESWCIVANVVSDGVFRKGAKVTVLAWNGDAEHAKCRGLNRRGRCVTKFIPFKRLENFRAGFVHNGDFAILSLPSKDDAEKMADSLSVKWSGIRFFASDGKTLIRDGRLASSAFGSND